MYIRYFGVEWYEELKDVLHSEYFTNLRKFLKEEYKIKIVYPGHKKKAKKYALTKKINLPVFIN